MTNAALEPLLRAAGLISTEPLRGNLLTSARERAVKKLENGKTGLDNLAQKLDQSPLLLLRRLQETLSPIEWEIISLVEGLGSPSLRTYAPLCGRLVAQGFKNLQGGPLIPARTKKMYASACRKAA